MQSQRVPTEKAQNCGQSDKVCGQIKKRHKIYQMFYKIFVE